MSGTAFAFVFAFALAFLSVIPEGNLLFHPFNIDQALTH